MLWLISADTHRERVGIMFNFRPTGLTLDDALTFAGIYAFFRSRNAKFSEPYHLNPEQLQFITAGYQAGESGAFGQPDDTRYSCNI
jgi:hypothetical protein